MTANCIYIPMGFGAVLEICTLPPPPLPPPPAPDLPDTPILDLPPLTGPGRAEATTPGARVEDLALERTRDDVCTTGCNACIAAASGYPDWVSYQNNKDQPVSGTADRGYRYQAQVSGLPHEPQGRRIMEWQWAGYSWDGIDIPVCTMLEAKFGYETFFADWDPSGPRLLDWAIKAGITTFKDTVIQLGVRQLPRIVPFNGKVKLRWVFSHHYPMMFFQKLADQAGYSDFEVVHQASQ